MKLLAYIVPLFLLLPSFAFADYVIDCGTATTDFSDQWFGGTGAGGYIEEAMKCTTIGAGTLNTMTSRMYKAGSPVDSVIVKIEEDNGSNLPGGTLLGTSDPFVPSATRTSVSNETITFSTPISLVAGHDYWVVFSRTGTFNDTNLYGVADDQSAGRFALRSSGTWSAYAPLQLDVHMTVSTGGGGGGGTTSNTADSNLALPWAMTALGLITVDQAFYFGMFFMAMFAIFFGVAFVYRAVLSIV